MMKMKTYAFETLHSTNDWAKEHIAEFDRDDLTLIKTKEQAAGHGRFGRRWHSPQGLTICASFCFFLPVGVPYLHNLSQVLAISAAKTLRRYNVDIILKWPNDLLLSGKKLGGVLCETVIERNEIGIINGIGLNVNVPESLLSTIDQPSTSLLVESKHEFNVDQLTNDLAIEYENHLKLLKKEGFAPFLPELQALMSSWINKTIHLSQGEKKEIKKQGIFHSINSDGTLNFYCDGVLNRIVSGEIDERSGTSSTSH